MQSLKSIGQFQNVLVNERSYTLSTYLFPFCRAARLWVPIFAPISKIIINIKTLND